jgi:hypothetical protein
MIIKRWPFRVQRSYTARSRSPVGVLGRDATLLLVRPLGTFQPRWCPCTSGCSAPSTPARWEPRPTLPAGPARRGIRPRHVACSPRSYRARTGFRPRAPPNPSLPAQCRRLDRRGGRCGRGTQPAGRTAAQLRAGPRPGPPRHPNHPRLARPLGGGGGGTWRTPGTCTRRCCPSASGSWAPSTRTPRPPAPASPTRPSEAEGDAGIM